MEQLLETAGEDPLLRNLLLNPELAEGGGFPGVQKPAPANVKAVAPKPGFCVKIKSDKGEKVFINICQGEHLPRPRDISDEDLITLLESDDPSGYRVPLSIGEPHVEVDKAGHGCTAYDVISHPDYLRTVLEREVMMGFFMTVVLEGVETKYSTSLDRNWKILKNRKFLGSLPEQNIRSTPQPLIQDMENPWSKPQKPLISEVTTPEKEPPKPKAPEPPYTIIQEPAEGHPEFLVAEIHLPKVKSAASVTLDVGEDRILLQTRSDIYHLDIYLPFDVIQEDCVSQYNRQTKILTITMPVVPKS